MCFLIYLFCSFLDDSSKLRAAEVEFLKDPANSHLFKEPATESDQNEKPKRKQLEKRKGKSAEANNPTKKKKEPELVCILRHF